VLDIFQRHTQANLNPLVSRYFSYGAFDDPAPARWQIETPDGSWRGSVRVFIGAEYPVAQVELWLDNRRMYAGAENAVTLDVSGIEAGEYVLLAKVFDHRGALYERARRITVAAP
jgi:hypothetical protein